MTLLGSLSDEELVKLAKQGDLEAFTSLYGRYFRIVYNRVHYVIPEADVEDVIQDIFVALLRSLKGFEARSLFRTWFRTLTNRQIAEYYRRKNQKGSSPPILFDEASQLPSKDDRQDIEGRLALQKALYELPDHYREIILMRFAEDLPFVEIAKVMKLHPEATKSLFRRAIHALTQKLEEKDVHETV